MHWWKVPLEGAMEGAMEGDMEGAIGGRFRRRQLYCP
jgi:hypothetical protein